MSKKPTYEELEQRVLKLEESVLQHQRFEEVLEEKESKLRQIIDLVPHPIFIKDEDGKFEMVNQAVADLFGTTVAELTGKRDADFVATDEEMEHFRADDLEVIKTGKMKFIPEEPITDSENNIRYLQTTKVPFNHSATKKTALLGVAVDITAHKETEIELREKTTMLDNILRSAQAVAIATTDLDFRVTYYNPLAEKFFGYTSDEVVGKTVMEMHFKENVMSERFEKAIEIVRCEGSYHYTVMQNRDDGVYEIDSSVFGIFDPEGRLVGYSLFAYDVTRSKQTEKEREQLRMAIEQVAETIVITDTSGAIQYVNPAFTQVSGYTRAEALGQNPRILQSGQQDEIFYRELWNTLGRGETWSGRFINRKKDRTLYTEEVTISPVCDNSGKTVNYVAVKRDISAELELEEQFQQAQKMEAIGTLAGGVAHDFNNILTVIRGHAQLAMMQTTAENPLWNDLLEIDKAGGRASNLTRQLLAFSRKQAIEPELLLINNLIDDLGKMLRRLIGEDITLKLELGEKLSPILADPGQLEQIIVNLVVNAADAIKDQPLASGRKITVSTSQIFLDHDFIISHPGCREGWCLLIEVSDNGCGISKAVMEHIFEPFYTTKEVGKGTGLGLATVYGIAKQNHAEISVESEPGLGATFKIYWPCVQGETSRTTVTEKPAAAPGGSEVILLVEDEESARNLGQQILQQAGYRVVVAENGLDALAQVENYSGPPIDLLFTDVVMPRMGGIELSEKLTTLQPKLKVLFASGHLGDRVNRDDERFKKERFINKPYDVSVLLKKIRQLLDGD